MRYLRDYGEAQDRRGSQQRIRDENLMWVFRLLYKHREISRSDLTRMTGLSPTTVSTLVEKLVREKLVVEKGFAPTLSTGRKPVNLQICAFGRQIPVFTLGRRSVRYTLYNLQLDVLESGVVPMDTARYWSGKGEGRNEFPEVGREYADLILKVLHGRSQRFSPEAALAICINYPGVQTQRDGNIIMPGMRVSIQPDHFMRLETEFGLPVFMGSLAQSMAYAEKKYLETEYGDDEALMFVAVRSGVSLGVIGEEEPALQNRFYGEMGHMSINYRGKPCFCGRKGCLEEYVSREAIIARVEQAISFHPCATLAGRGDQLTLEMIGMAYDAGEREIVKVINEVAEQLYAGIYNAMCLTGVRRVFIGGGIERLGRGFLECIRMHAMSAGDFLQLSPSIDYGHIAGEDAGRGIARYYIEKVFRVGKKLEI